MDCRAFRKRHLAFVDDTLPGVDVGRMQEHLEVCPGCSAWDHRVRRSLMVARNHLRTIEPSQEFSQRLASRLAAERQNAAWSLAPRREPMIRWSGIAVVVVTLTVIGAATVSFTRVPEVGIATLPAVVTAPSLDEVQPALPDAKPAFLASMSSGMAILPALMLAEEVPIRRASSDGSGVTLRTAGLTYPNPEQH
jgi:predicted anti-sigma-YlaC factor YlaD